MFYMPVENFRRTNVQETIFAIVRRSVTKSSTLFALEMAMLLESSWVNHVIYRISSWWHYTSTSNWTTSLSLSFWNPTTATSIRLAYITGRHSKMQQT